MLVRQVAQLAQLLTAVGWGYSQIGSNNLAAHPNALKSQMIGGLHAVAYLRGDYDQMLRSLTHCMLTNVLACAVPLIAINTVVILVKLVFG